MRQLAKLVLLTITSSVLTKAWSAPQVPGFFIFGDSLVDNGNNNGILTLARANYYPYGIDFEQGSTGRFTNGLTTVDFLARLLGFRHFIPPYATAQRSEVLRGLNFASGAAGIREETGNNLGQHYHFAEQVEHFGDAVQYITRMFRGNTTRVHDHLRKCVYLVGMGSNDYLNNYFMPNMYRTSYDYSPKTYASLLIQDYSRQLTAFTLREILADVLDMRVKEPKNLTQGTICNDETTMSQLYDLGARKIVIVGIGQIGCIPYELARMDDDDRQGGRRCNGRINRAISMYNTGLYTMVRRFNRELPGAKFVYVDTFKSSNDLVNNAASYGFSVIDRGCCGVGRNNGQITCLPLQQPCEDRTKYLFWDAFHPTEAANLIYARKAYYSNSSSDVYPMNLKQLAMA